MTDTDSLRRRVQRNCDIVDACHAQAYSLCTYLLKMRELYRWEHGLPETVKLGPEQVGDWVCAREALWDTLESAEPAPIEVDGRRYDPFDEPGLDAALRPRGLAYGAGYGLAGQPHFYLARLERIEARDGVTVRLLGEELARDLASPPAMARAGVVTVRVQSLRRSLWELFDEWRWREREGPMAALAERYDLGGSLGEGLTRAAGELAEVAVLHELGEVRAGERLGPAWDPALCAIAGTPAEHVARAVRDLLADCLLTLPSLAAEWAEAGGRKDGAHAARLHYFFANLRGWRARLAPGLDAAYRHWRESGSVAAIDEAARAGAAHWAGAAGGLFERLDELRGVAGPAGSSARAGQGQGSFEDRVAAALAA